ncbi:unnamed protein product [Phytomonas sp. EM1]|nr:unnamed protein product [Phytomonas sp. EM1]|eukprot:CCW60476.1 unnamed protein product [Phytomonas sp. isolate EM1]
MKTPVRRVSITKSTFIPDNDSGKRYPTHLECIVYSDLDLSDEIHRNPRNGRSRKQTPTTTLPGIMKNTHKQYTQKPIICSDVSLNGCLNPKVCRGYTFPTLKSSYVHGREEESIRRSSFSFQKSSSSFNSFSQEDNEYRKITTGRRSSTMMAPGSAISYNIEAHPDVSSSRFGRGLSRMVDMSTLFIASERCEDAPVAQHHKNCTNFQFSNCLECSSLISDSHDFNNNSFINDSFEDDLIAK